MNSAVTGYEACTKSAPSVSKDSVFLLVGYFRVPITEHEVSIHLVHVPPSARHDGVCLRWHSVPVSSSFAGCWALDNVLISSIVGLPRQLQDDFDPVDISNWLFYPGGRIEVCVDYRLLQLFVPSFTPSVL